MSRVGGSQKGIQNLSQTRPAKSVLSECPSTLLLICKKLFKTRLSVFSGPPGENITPNEQCL